MLARQVAQASRSEPSLSFIVTEVDGLRQINAHFGSLVGDELLADVAKLWKSTFWWRRYRFPLCRRRVQGGASETTEEQAERPVKRRLRAVEFWNLNSARRYETGFSWGYCFLPGRIRCGLCSAGGGWQTVPEKTQADTDFLTCKREKGNNRADSCTRGLAVSQIPGLALPAPISSVQDHFSKFLQWRPSFSIRSSASFGPHVPAA